MGAGDLRESKFGDKNLCRPGVSGDGFSDIASILHSLSVMVYRVFIDDKTVDF